MPTQSKKILIVEDEQAMRRVIAAKCVEDGFSTLEAADGEEGLNLALKEHPDLILLDLKMPKMDGVEVLKELRKDEWGKSVPVLVFTNVKDAEKVAEVLEAGTYDYFVKGGELEDIMKIARQKLGLT